MPRLLKCTGQYLPGVSNLFSHFLESSRAFISSSKGCIKNKNKSRLLTHSYSGVLLWIPLDPNSANKDALSLFLFSGCVSHQKYPWPDMLALNNLSLEVTTYLLQWPSPGHNSFWGAQAPHLALQGDKKQDRTWHLCLSPLLLISHLLARAR